MFIKNRLAGTQSPTEARSLICHIYLGIWGKKPRVSAPTPGPQLSKARAERPHNSCSKPVRLVPRAPNVFCRHTGEPGDEGSWPATHTPPSEIGKVLILFYRSQVNPSMLILVIGQDMLCVAQLYLFFQTQREPSISTMLVPTAYLFEDRASTKRLGITLVPRILIIRRLHDGATKHPPFSQVYSPWPALPPGCSVPFPPQCGAPA